MIRFGCPACGTTGSTDHEPDGAECRLLQADRFQKQADDQ